MNDNYEVEAPHAESSSQVRLALIELVRIEREIATIEESAWRAQEDGTLLALRVCRASLVRMTTFRWPERSADAIAAPAAVSTSSTRRSAQRTLSP